MTDSQSQVSDAAGPVLLDQNVLGLQVSVGDRWLTWGEERRTGEIERHREIEREARKRTQSREQK